MSYQSEILADSPVLYWRLDRTGAPSNGDEIPDLSGNDFHGELNFVSFGPEPYGYASPIETDATSREFKSYSAPPYLATITKRSESEIEFSGNFTLEAWVRPSTLAINFVQKQKLFDGSCYRIGIDTNGRIFGEILDSAGTAFRVTDNSIASQTELTQGNSYHVVFVRSGNSLLLYRNAVLKASASVSSGLGTLDEAGEFLVGGGISGAYNFRVDEVALYGSALSGARALAHYEAALTVLPLRATITINIGVELNTEQIIPVDLGFPHNYSATFGGSDIPIVEELSWKTNVNKSEPDYEQRINAQPHGAYRSIEYHLSPSSAPARSSLQGALWTPAEFYCIPLWRDAGLTTGSANSGANTIPVDTTKRRYAVGSYCGTATNLQNPTTYQFFKITAVADDGLTLGSNIGTTIPSGSWVFPACLASISEDSLAFKSFAADHEDSVIRFDVLETELFTRDTTEYTPSTTYKSIEVFTLESAKYSFLDEKGYSIARRIQALGRDYQYGRDTGSPQTFPVRFLLKDRDQLSEFFGWLDARQGKQNPLWVSSKESDLTITAKPGSFTATVSPKTGFSFHHGRRDIEILKTDGSFVRLRAISVTENSTSETWTFHPLGDVVPAVNTISRASFLKFCTLSSDTVQIRYFKGGSSGAVIATCDLSLRELLTSPA